MSQQQGLMAGKRGLIMGLANQNSIAWGIAQSLHREGAELAFSYVGEAMAKRVKPLAQSIGAELVFDCDVASDDALDAGFAKVAETWDRLDFVVHAIGFSDKNELRGPYLNTSRANFAMTLDISAYSLVAVAQRAAPLMLEGGSLLTLSYLGAELVIPNYNVMGVAKAALEASTRYLAADLGPSGIRVNAISAGAIRTLAASGIGAFRSMLKWSEHLSPLRQNVSIDEVGDAALYLLSDLSRGVTGVLHYVDAGANLMGMPPLDEAEAMSAVLKEMG